MAVVTSKRLVLALATAIMPLIIHCPYAVLAQQTASSGTNGAPLTLVRFHAEVKKGQPTTDIRPEDIEIIVDGQPQPVALLEHGYSSSCTVPLRILILFDHSRSAVQILRRTAPADGSAIRDYLLDAFPNSSAAVYGFSGVVARLTEPTRDPSIIAAALNRVITLPSMDSPLFESVIGVIRDDSTRPGNAVRILAVFSDGETTGQESADNAIKFAQDNGVAVFAVQLIDPSRNLSQRQGDAMSASFERVPAHFRVASGTGGLKYSATKPGFQALPESLRWIAAQIRNDYVVGFYPSTSGQQKRHKVDVVLRAKSRRILGGRTAVY